MGRILRGACISVLTMAAVSLLNAQTDKPGSKDPQLFSRIPSYYILDYREAEFDSAEFPVGEGAKLKRERVEGRKTFVLYALKKDAQVPGILQVVRNYEAAAKSLGGEVLYQFEAPNARRSTLRIVKGGSEAWAFVEAFPATIRLTIVEKKAMRQDVVADAAAFANDLKATGKVAVYGIYFDTAKSELKPESDAALAEIGKLLQQNPTLKVCVVGHTDMVGDFAANLKLSQARAQAVVTSLVTKHGVESGRLVPFGAGPYAPVASNRDEDGRAKNRRVELVEIATR